MFPQDIHILIVDDMKGVRILISKLLGELGYKKISEAGNGQEAFDALENQRKSGNAVGLVIADFRMPVMDGLQFLAKVRNSSEYASLPFIMLSAESEKDNVIQALKAGVTDYLIKPATVKTLQKKLENAWGIIHGTKTA
jgi:two-component system chemotaxis response regulator CheY